MATEITEYDPSWPISAKQVCEELTGALPGLFAGVEHVGSTSVPGLAAKPVIDLMASVATLDDLTPEREAVLERLGYARQETGMPQRLFFHRDDDAGRRSHHLHIVTSDSAMGQVIPSDSCVRRMPAGRSMRNGPTSRGVSRA